jgi:hypothetical protein
VSTRDRPAGRSSLATPAGIALCVFLAIAATAGALLSNPFWAWWGDACGKGRCHRAHVPATARDPCVARPRGGGPGLVLPWFAAVFFLLGATGNGETIPARLSDGDLRRLDYSGYFNALTAPAALAPVLGAAVLTVTGAVVLFAASAATALLELCAVRRLRQIDGAWGASKGGGFTFQVRHRVDEQMPPRGSGRRGICGAWC